MSNRAILEELPGVRGQLFECARWIDNDLCFQWVDIRGATLHRYWPETGAVVTRRIDLPVLPAALEWDADEIVLAGRDVLVVYSWRDERMTTLCRFDLPDDVRLNDGAVAPSGDVWIGSMTEGGAERRGQLFRVTPDGAVSVQLDGVGISNGLVWDGPDRGCYVDSTFPRIDRLRLDASGDLAERSTLVELDGQGEPDGLALDRNGALHVAIWDGNRVDVVDADRRAIRSIRVDGKRPTSIAFGGCDEERVFVTSAAVEDGVSAEPGRCWSGGSGAW